MSTPTYNVTFRVKAKPEFAQTIRDVPEDMIASQRVLLAQANRLRVTDVIMKKKVRSDNGNEA